MKTKFGLLLSIAFLLVLSSCSKEKVEEKTGNNGLVGKWRLVERYDGYVNGGSFTWQSVAAANSHTLEFTANGQFFKVEASGTNPSCSGTYQLSNSNLLQITSSCQTETGTKISELTNQNLILDYQVREGIIRYKYMAVP